MNWIAKALSSLFGLIAGIAGIFYAGRKSAESKAKAEQAERKAEAIERENKVIQDAANVHENVGKLDPGGAADRLQDDWSRD